MTVTAQGRASRRRLLVRWILVLTALIMFVPSVAKKLAAGRKAPAANTPAEEVSA